MGAKQGLNPASLVSPDCVLEVFALLIRMVCSVHVGTACDSHSVLVVRQMAQTFPDFQGADVGDQRLGTPPSASSPFLAHPLPRG